MTTKDDKGGVSSAPVSRPASMLPPTADAPPAYREGCPRSQADLVAAGTLLLTNTTIYDAGSASAPPLYELSYAVANLRESYTKVLFYRYEHKISERRPNDNGDDDAVASNPGPRVTSRKKHIFDLRRDPTIMLSSFPYHLDSVSRSGLGTLGLKAHHSSSKDVRAVRLTRTKANAEWQGKDRVFDARRSGDGRYEWRDEADDGRILAHETADGNGSYQLQVVTPMAHKRRDALVATWCLRLWREIAMANTQPLTWAHIKHVLQYDTKEFPVGTGAGY